MPHATRRRYSVDDYFAVELASTVKHEYLDGEIYAMAGASVRHNHVSANVLAFLRRALQAGPCSAFGSDLRVHTPADLYTYADVVVVCGDVELVPHRPDTATNPTVLVEVLSDSTRDYDATEKLAMYQGIASLREVLLVEQDTARVLRVARADHGWETIRVEGLDGAVSIEALGVVLPLREIYRRVLS